MQRFTRLDENIKILCGVGLSLNPKQIYTNRERILLRLDNLRKIGLCSFANGAYQLSKNWEDDLKANSRYNTYLAARSYLKHTDQVNLKVFSGEHGTITGKVTKIFSPEDDTSNNHAVIVESLDGKAYFVPLLKKPEMHNGNIKMGVMEGDLVSIKTYENQRGRLTPVIFKRDSRGVIKEIKKNGHSGSLAAEIKSIRT